jgi:hypothetical protein
MFRTASALRAATAAIAAATLVAACGSSSSSSSSTAAALTYAQAQRDAVSFADCVRSHGVPNFPDPASPRDLKESITPSVSRSPAFRSAAATCRHLLPGGGGSNEAAARGRGQIAAELAFARCLRRHGFPNFPDPTTSGELTREMLAGAGIDIHQPAIIQAADACVGVTHGVITKAAVARFVAGR